MWQEQSCVCCHRRKDGSRPASEAEQLPLKPGRDRHQLKGTGSWSCNSRLQDPPVSQYVPPAHQLGVDLSDFLSGEISQGFSTSPGW
jgi:hypothetical protein